MKSYFILIFLSFLAAGCIASQIQSGNPLEYELPGIDNTTIFYLNGSSVQVVESVINSTSVDFLLDEGGEMNFRNPVAQDYQGNNVTFNVSSIPIFGRSYAHFEFEQPFSGFVAFTQSDGQDFKRILTRNNSVRVVLPVNYTTGSNFLGIAQPEPDNITIDASGRKMLIWNNPYPAPGKISVQYYPESATDMLAYLFVFLLVASVLIWGYYRLSIRALKKKREKMEKGIKK